MRSVVFTPSNLKLFMQCPLKFKLMTLDKAVPYVQSEKAKRGERLHALMEKCLRSGWDSVKWDDTLSYDHARKFYTIIMRLVDDGWVPHIEDSVATDATGHACEFWDRAPANLLRCRIDLWLDRSDTDTVMVFDHKTGKRYASDKIQLQVNAACLRPVTRKDHYVVSFDYLDNGELATTRLDVSGLDLTARSTNAIKASTCAELLVALRGAERAIERGDFPPCRNRFCDWCDCKSMCPLHKS